MWFISPLGWTVMWQSILDHARLVTWTKPVEKPLSGSVDVCAGISSQPREPTRQRSWVSRGLQWEGNPRYLGIAWQGAGFKKQTEGNFTPVMLTRALQMPRWPFQPTKRRQLSHLGGLFQKLSNGTFTIRRLVWKGATSQFSSAEISSLHSTLLSEEVGYFQTPVSTKDEAER